MALPALAKDRASSFGAQLTIIRNGTPIHTEEKDHRDIIRRIVDAFNDQTESTEDLPTRNYFERDGIPLKEKWEQLQKKSLFHITTKPLKQSKYAKKMGLKPRARVTEVLVSFNEEPHKKLFGTVLAKMNNDEIRGYIIQDTYLINVYCAETSLKYLPDHYGILFEKYNNEEYIENGIQCSKDN